MIKIKVDIARLTLNDVIYLQDNPMRLPPRFTRQLLAKVVVDDSGEYLDEAEALQLVGDVPLGDIREVMDEFRRQLTGEQEESVPPTNGGS